ncbi:MAG: NAD(P)H-hydrate epimerase, partial [Thermocrispum sp.]
MREVWTTERVRAAEAKVLARTPPGGLMRRAAFAVSVRAAELLAEHAGRVAGARVALLVGSGDNGGDALWAGAMLRRRGVGVTAVLLDPERGHAEGLAALR